jgi:hypothetical protein
MTLSRVLGIFQMMLINALGDDDDEMMMIVDADVGKL